MSSSPDLVRSHIVYFLLGIIAYYIFSQLDYSLFSHIHRYIFGIGVFLLALTYLFAETRFGSARWLHLGPFNFQPSEFVKFSLILTFSAIIQKNQSAINNPKSLGEILIYAIIPIALIILQPDLGTAIVILALFFGLLYFGGISTWYIVTTFLLFGILSTPVWHLLHDYQKQRILVFVNPQSDVLGSGYNVIQSMIAVGSGGIFGKGFGRGTQSNLQFLPAYWTDFIFASFAEEWGFIGVFLLISIYVIMLLVILNIAIKTKDYFGKLLVLGVFLIFIVQFTVNIGMNLGIMPVTGVTLPLVSYGGSSILLSMVLLGVVQSVYSSTLDRR